MNKLKSLLNYHGGKYKQIDSNYNHTNRNKLVDKTIKELLITNIG